MSHLLKKITKHTTTVQHHQAPKRLHHFKPIPVVTHTHIKPIPVHTVQHHTHIKPVVHHTVSQTIHNPLMSKHTTS
jgi:hypothetical protein